jgi:hypothetical protein
MLNVVVCNKTHFGFGWLQFLGLTHRDQDKQDVLVVVVMMNLQCN